MTKLTLQKLNFPNIKLRAREAANTISIWDPLRRCYIVLTPEEWVRQHLISFLISSLSIPPTQIILEYPVTINRQNQRADIVVVGRDTTPQILVECKAPDVKVSQQTLDQAVRYNSIVKARYIILTNGINHYIYQKESDEGEYSPLSDLTQIVL